MRLDLSPEQIGFLFSFALPLSLLVALLIGFAIGYCFRPKRESTNVL